MGNSAWKVKLAAGLFAAAACVGAQAALIQSAVTTLGGAAIEFEGFAEGTRIDTQYPGIKFGQTDGGRPQIDNSPFLYGYGAKSGTGVLTGSTDGGATFQAVAELSIELVSPGSALEFWLSDNSPLGIFTISAYNSANVLIGSFAVSVNSFVGFSGFSDLKRVTVDSSTTNDAFAIDDVRFAPGSTVPEPQTLALVVLALLGAAFARRRSN